MGMLAAAGLHALRHHVDRLADDHARIRRLYDGLLAGAPALSPSGLPETNILYFGTVGFPAADFVAGCEARGVRTIALGPNVVRGVAHLEVTDDDVERALAAFCAVSAELG